MYVQVWFQNQRAKMKKIQKKARQEGGNVSKGVCRDEELEEKAKAQIIKQEEQSESKGLFNKRLQRHKQKHLHNPLSTTSFDYNPRIRTPSQITFSFSYEIRPLFEISPLSFQITYSSCTLLIKPIAKIKKNIGNMLESIDLFTLPKTK